MRSQEDNECYFDVKAEVFTKKRSDLIDIVQSHFDRGQDQVFVI